MRITTRSAMVAIVSSFVATSCGTSIGVTPLNASPRPLQARAPADVEVFATALPPHPYVDVAQLEAEQTSELSGDGHEQFVAKLRVQAAEIGCDGIILGQPTAREESSLSDAVHDLSDATSKRPRPKPENYGQPVTLHGLTATCIVYRDPSHAAVAVPPAAPAIAAEPPVVNPSPMPPAVAAAPDEQAIARYETCRRERIAIMRRAAQIKDLPARGRMFGSMPSCGTAPVGWHASR